MKKQAKAGKKLLLTSEKVRDLQPRQLGQVAGGNPTDGTSYSCSSFSHQDGE